MADTNCEFCKTPGSLKKCSACKNTYYCSTECQRKAWSEHKKSCGVNSDKKRKKDDFVQKFISKRNNELLEVKIKSLKEEILLLEDARQEIDVCMEDEASFL